MCKPETAGQRLVLLPQPLLIDEHAHALFEAELAHIGGFQLSAEGVGHSVQFHGVQLLNRWLVQHSGFLFGCGFTAEAWSEDRNTERRAHSRAAGWIFPV